MKLKNINEAMESIILNIQNNEIPTAIDYMKVIPFDLDLKDEIDTDIEEFKRLAEEFWNISADLKDEVSMKFKMHVKNLFETIEK